MPLGQSRTDDSPCAQTRDNGNVNGLLAGSREILRDRAAKERARARARALKLERRIRGSANPAVYSLFPVALGGDPRSLILNPKS